MLAFISNSLPIYTSYFPFSVSLYHAVIEPSWLCETSHFVPCSSTGIITLFTNSTLCMSFLFMLVFPKNPLFGPVSFPTASNFVDNSIFVKLFWFPFVSSTIPCGNNKYALSMSWIFGISIVNVNPIFLFSSFTISSTFPIIFADNFCVLSPTINDINDKSIFLVSLSINFDVASLIPELSFTSNVIVIVSFRIFRFAVLITGDTTSTISSGVLFPFSSI